MILMHGEVRVIVIVRAGMIAVGIMYMSERRFGKSHQRCRDHEDVESALHLTQV